LIAISEPVGTAVALQRNTEVPLNSDIRVDEKDIAADDVKVQTGMYDVVPNRLTRRNADIGSHRDTTWSNLQSGKDDRKSRIGYDHEKDRFNHRQSSEAADALGATRHLKPS